MSTAVRSRDASLRRMMNGDVPPWRPGGKTPMPGWIFWKRDNVGKRMMCGASSPAGRWGRMAASAGAVFILWPAAQGIAQDQTAAETYKQPNAITFQVENDLFGGGSDRHYTQGMRLSWLPSPDDVPYWARKGATLVPGIDTSDRFTFVFSLGQNMYTPEDITTRTPDPTDRPYAGWLYASIGAVAEDSERDILHNLALDVGVVGPLSLAGETQSFWHDLIGAREPRGWDHQLKNEPGVVLTYSASWRDALVYSPGFLEVDVTPRAGVALGNVFTHAAVGASLRVGQNLHIDYGPPYIRPNLPGGGLVRSRNEMGWYLFAGVEGRAVARNIFLDGNTFADSASVDKRPFIGDLQFGATLTYHRYRLSFTQILRTEEFYGQRGGDHYGSIALTYLF